MNAKEMVTRQQTTMKDVLQEMGATNSFRVKALLLTNFIESLLKDFMEFLLKTEEGREIPRNLIVKILLDKKIINSEISKDIKHIFEIRDAYAHHLSLIQANAKIEKEILPKMKCVKHRSSQIPDWNKRDLDTKIIDVSDWVFANLLMDFDQMTKQPIRIRTKRD